MAQAMRAMQVSAMNGALAGNIVDTPVSLRNSKRVPVAGRRGTVSVRASLKKDERDVLAPAAVVSAVVLADAGAANALTSEDITGAFSKVRSSSLYSLL